MESRNGSKTFNTIRNAAANLICQFMLLIFAFVNRTIFIRTLSMDYLGINGLFANVLMLISLAELGFGGIVAYYLYAPLELKNHDKIKQLMYFYKTTYRIIGFSVFILGLIAIPFFPFFIKSAPDIRESIYVILLNSAISYFWVYKRTILVADQKNYIVAVYMGVFKILQYVLQIIFLMITHNFIIYLIIQVACTIANNLAISIKADRQYPYIREKSTRLPVEEKKSIMQNVKASFAYQIGNVILNGCDSVIISAIIDITTVGLLSNYNLILSNISNILSKIIDSLTASVGKFNTVNSAEKKEKLFEFLSWMNSAVYGYFCVGFALLANFFIESVWLGHGYVFSQITVLAAAFGLYILGMQNVTVIFRDTCGMFVYGKTGPIISAVLNIILSISFCKFFGLTGILIATPIARFVTVGIIDPYVIYKRVFFSRLYKFYLQQAGYFISFIAIYLLADKAIGFITVSGAVGFILKGLIYTIIFAGTEMVIGLKNGYLNQTLNYLGSLRKDKINA